jgi:serine/threonine-protein kinase ULK/ATG1
LRWCTKVEQVVDRGVGVDATGRKVAVKQIVKSKLEPEQLAALKEEVRVMASLSSEHIVRLYDVKQTKKPFYMMLEYCSGGDLESLAKTRQDERTVQRYIHQISKGLKVLFDHNIMHRDLKFGNILRSSKDENAILKLTDFGVARRVQDSKPHNTFCGTPMYMAPEMLFG